MLKIVAQIIKDEDGYKFAVQVKTENELEVTHTKLLGLTDDAIESFLMMRLPFSADFEDIADPVSSLEAIEIVKKQNEELAAKKAAAEAEAAVAVEGEIVA